jgi:class 3 adenylate cyclase
MEAVGPRASRERPAQSTKLVAIMFADMVSYSKHIEKDEAANASNAERSIELFKAPIGDYGGRIANVLGDGILALFDTADGALRFAIQIQTEFLDQSVWDDGDPIQFRIGLNLGEVTADATNFHVHSVNVAARVQALAEPNSIFVTAAIREAVHDVPGITLRSLGQPSGSRSLSSRNRVLRRLRSSRSRVLLQRLRQHEIPQLRCLRFPISRVIRATTIFARVSPRISSPT